MTREIRISSENFKSGDASDDCYLSPDDPVHALKAQAMIGTLRPESVAAVYDAHKRQIEQAEHFRLRDQARTMGIRPGTPAWFALNQSKQK